ncbi:MAG: protein-L-isoaspartate(D-aspartate) O-methyltransferase [Bdellovibrio sp.]|nr:protein-L-isoaspartate(D-aspartate) O-methyltransferase [Bdellovibrio sp.]
MIRVFVLIAAFLVNSGVFETVNYESQRNHLLDIINKEIKSLEGHTGISELSASVYSAIKNTPREQFVPPDLRPFAYENRPLSIGHGQTISQPLIVALMTELLKISPTHTVLEIGTGSGHQAAILSRLAKEVHTIEIIPSLAKKAQDIFQKFGYQNIFSYIGDGYIGLTQHAPYDAIIVTAASSHIPPPLLKQLKEGGKMVIPVGGAYQTQNLILLTKTSDGFRSRNILPVRFVPMVREK